MKIKTNIICSAFALFAFACFALSPQARAACNEGCDGGGDNTFLGEDALGINPHFYGSNNTAIGSAALRGNQSGSNNNTATGYNTLFYNEASDNTATGYIALVENTTGFNNTATGSEALAHNTTGSNNTATGYRALSGIFPSEGGNYNTANGAYALYNNEADANTAVGYSTLYSDTTGASNTALGRCCNYAHTRARNCVQRTLGYPPVAWPYPGGAPKAGYVCGGPPSDKTPPKINGCARMGSGVESRCGAPDHLLSFG